MCSSDLDGKSKVSLLLNGLVLIGPPVFIIGLVLTLSWVVEKALNTIQSQIGHLALPHSDFVFLLDSSDGEQLFGP